MTSLRMELFVEELQASLNFYNKLLNFQEKVIKEGYVSIKNGSVILGLGLITSLPSDHYLALKSSDERKGIGVEIVLEVDDINDYYQRVLDQSYPTQDPLQRRSWGLTDFRIVDPDGYYLRITSKN